MSPSTQFSHSRRGNTALTALFTVLGSETIFFGTLLAAYFYMRVSLTSWQMTGAPFARLALPTANTFLLLISAGTMTLALQAIRNNDLAGLRRWLSLSLVLGLFFVAGQVFEFNHSGMRVNDQAFGGVFFTLIGFHALHVLAGVIMLAIVLWRAFLGDFSSRRLVAVQASTWFWYFVTGVWVILFAALYLV
ncbi:MAG TPA: cytochrome c oxidase subunit 3 [Anaerolineaceae bacterium]|nr:cytochrome c oxidase subunit 3 [Anaerolineaceae bacterium]